MSPIIVSVLVFFLVVGICISAYFAYDKYQKSKAQKERINQIVNYSGPTGVNQQQQKQTANVKVLENKQNEQKGSEENGLRKDKRISSIPLLNQFLSKFFSSQLDSVKILIF